MPNLEKLAQIWMVQCRSLEAAGDRVWTPTGATYFNTRTEARTYIETMINTRNFEYLQYRACKYIPVDLR